MCLIEVVKGLIERLEIRMEAGDQFLWLPAFVIAAMRKRQRSHGKASAAF